MFNSKPISNFEPRKENILTKISDFFSDNDVVHFLNKQGRFIGRLFSWIPVIYSDEDWDYLYLLTIMEFKLKRMRKVIVEDDVHADASRTLKKIDIILGRMERFIYPEKFVGHFPCSDNVDDWFERMENGNSRLKESTPEQKEWLGKSIKFESKNYKGFFKALEKYLTQIWS